LQLLDEKGVQFRFKMTPEKFVGSDGKLKEVMLKDGTILPADLCVVGAGVLPVTDFLKGSGLNISDRGFVVVNKHMETSENSVYAVGDIAQFPLFLSNDDSINIQHWQMAHQHGRICALNIAGKKTPIHSVPFFWTMLCGKGLRYTGYGFGYDDVVIHGDVNELKFVAFYTKGDKVIAVATMNNDPVAAQAAQVMLREQAISKEEVKKDPLGWTKTLSTPRCTHF
jgi:NADPH-dependent 2,4-dienoyl-CoA reductase/sulfur reductase-like enzyme